MCHCTRIGRYVTWITIKNIFVCIHKILYYNTVKAIIDTSTLISLARISYLELVSRLNVNIILSRKVYEEAVVEGKAKGFVDAIVIQGFIDSYNLKIIEVKEKFVKILRRKIKKTLVKGDESVLALAIQEHAEWIITNDDGLGKIAMVLGFQVKATPDLLLKALEKKLFDVCKLEILMRELVVENRLSYKVAELYIIEAKNYVKE